MKILVLDSNLFTLNFIKNLLQQESHVVKTHQNGYIINKDCFDLLNLDAIITDCDLQIIDGIEVIEHIAQTSPIPVLLHSCKKDFESRHRKIHLPDLPLSYPFVTFRSKHEGHRGIVDFVRNLKQ